MIIFMEYCSHGTIEEAARQGLPEVVIRRYTKDIVTAVDFLHEHNVVHRDIKGISTLCYSESHTSPVHVACAAIHFLHETHVTVTVANRKLVQNVPSSGNWAQ